LRVGFEGVCRFFLKCVKLEVLLIQESDEQRRGRISAFRTLSFWAINDWRTGEQEKSSRRLRMNSKNE
jgi:hypothetical protein